MKTLRIFSLMSLCIAINSVCMAQPTKTETIKVSGECGMCKKKIEKAAKEAGATYALWNVDTKVLTVKYSTKSTNTAKIEQKVAGVGYDTPDFKASEEAYNKLDDCCKYEREAKKDHTSVSKEKTCCDKEVAAAGDKASCCQKQDSKTAMNSSNAKSCCQKKTTTN